MRKEHGVYGLIIWFLFVSILLGLVFGCSHNTGYSAVDCDKHYRHIGKTLTAVDRESILRNVHLRCIDGMPVKYYWDGLDRKWNRQRNTRRI